MARLELENVGKVYPGGVRAVDGVDLRVGDREFVVLVGPSGCGKTTTLRMIAGLEEVSAGVIRIGERVVNDVAPRDRDIAMVFQNYALYPHMTVYKNMAFGLKLRGMAKAQIQERVMEAARMLDLAGLLDRKPRQLSGGQRQRVAVGRAIVREPAAFLFDEPLSNLDANLRMTTRAELKRLHQRLKVTTLYVTHDQEEAMTLGDRIVVMKEGRIQQADGPLAVYNRPVNRFVAGFIGVPPMNFFDGVVKNIDGRMYFEEGKIGREVGGGEGPAGRGRSVEAASNRREELTLPGSGFRLEVPAHLQSALARVVGGHVVLGIRPEDFHLSSPESGERPAKIEVKLSVIEPLGHDMDVYMDTNLHQQVVARVEATPDLQASSQATMFVDLRRVHFFEPGETGMNLSLLNEPTHAIA
jgi:multiple sugar transport system ATP-binding protein